MHGLIYSHIHVYIYHIYIYIYAMFIVMIIYNIVVHKLYKYISIAECIINK